MLIIPAIDLRGGRAVRLLQGRFDAETAYSDDPLAVARGWHERGAPWIHVVDLDGARAGRPRHLDLVSRIAGVGPRIELGGGLRSLDDLEAAFAAGVSRVVLGTAAVERPALLGEAARAFGSERVALGLDARGGLVAVRGWEETTAVAALDLIGPAREAGVEWVIYTDIERDGTLTSPNFEAVAVVARSGARVIASGGVASWEHLERLAGIDGVEAAIVGTALYDGTLAAPSGSDWWITPPSTAVRRSGEIEGER